MKLWKLFARFPKWVIAGTIILGSSAIFFLWYSFRYPGSSGQAASAASVHQPRKLAMFGAGEVLLCGNTLVDTKTGEILAREWLDGYGDRVPTIVKVMPDERRVLVLGDKGGVIPFDFDGNPKPPLAADGKRIGAAAYSQGCGEVVFVRDGNLWRGNVDWKNSTVEAAQRITDTGYFREEIFQGQWLWQGDFLLVRNLGRLLSVSLTNGKIQPDNSNLGEVMRGISPDGALCLTPVGTRELGVYDFASGEMTTFPTGLHVNGVLWLSSSRAIVQVGQNQLGLYDRSTEKLTGIFKSDNPLKEIIGPSPDGECFLVRSSKNAGFFDLKANRLTPFQISVDQLEWVSSDLILASFSAVSSEQRGIWLIGRDGKSKKILGEPVDAPRNRGQNATPILPDGYFVALGDLWCCEAATGKIRQTTHDGALTPFLRSLK